MSSSSVPRSIPHYHLVYIEGDSRDVNTEARANSEIVATKMAELANSNRTTGECGYFDIVECDSPGCERRRPPRPKHFSQARRR